MRPLLTVRSRSSGLFYAAAGSAASSLTPSSSERQNGCFQHNFDSLHLEKGFRRIRGTPHYARTVKEDNNGEGWSYEPIEHPRE